ncbi:MAG TPA: PEP-utilizing enzyme [Patescibacteria group bacterium]|nr:PEP-utilizing enzyme [Patescibacteria group bacterium]
MGIEKALESLEELLKDWGLSQDDWVFTSQYAYRLLGYEVKVREGHFNILVNKNKLPWKVGEGLEIHPPKGTKSARQYHQFVKKTGFEVDIIPGSPLDFEKRSKKTIRYSLPNRKQILVHTPWGCLGELNLLLSQCNDKGWGEDKGARVLTSVDDQRKVFLRRGEKKLAETYGDLIKKYSFLIKKRKIPKAPEKIKKISGIVASKGKASGRVRVILDPARIERFNKGEILVTKMTSPKFTTIIQKTSAIVTDEGGILCHAAIISREMKIPCVVGTQIATKALKDGDLVDVNAEKGVVRKL